MRTNLAFMQSARNAGADVHVVTELVTSLLGLIVFPYERIKQTSPARFKKYRLDDFSSQGWPSFTFDIGSSEDLDNLIYHLRNAISHRRLTFSSDSREPKEVEIAFRDRKPKATVDYWGATINAFDLQKFVLLFAGLLNALE